MILETGLDIISSNQRECSLLKGRVGYLCHSASLNKSLIHGAELLSDILGNQLHCFFGPQHGFASDAQDNMVETPNFAHPYFQKNVYSLYEKNHSPSKEMLEEIDTLLVDLQDIGTRVYTYMTTLGLCMEACEREKKRIVVLDRPNPAGPLIEGRILLDRPQWKSFVGHLPIPQRHGLTLGEAALLQKKLYSPDVDLHIIKMKGYHHQLTWPKTGRPWINPSPNLATPNSAFTFPGTVLFEGTTLSEGRGTTRALEIVGAPFIEPFSFRDRIQEDLDTYGIEGVTLIPQGFSPTFQKHQGNFCGGLFIDVETPTKARTWRLGQLLLKHFKSLHKKGPFWRKEAYEYEFDRLAIDIINGGEEMRHWVEKKRSGARELFKLEDEGLEEYLKLRESCLLYPES